MSQVYVVISGDYSEYEGETIAVFNSKAEAMKVVALLGDHTHVKALPLNPKGEEVARLEKQLIDAYYSH